MKSVQEKIKVMEHYANGGEIETTYNNGTSWVTVENPAWNWVTCDYRIKEYTYPMWFKSNTSGKIVKFDDISSGTVVKSDDIHKVGHYSKGWTKHTDSSVWTQVDKPIETITIERWLMSRGDEYYILDTSNIENYTLSTPVKLLDRYQIEI